MTQVSHLRVLIPTVIVGALAISPVQPAQPSDAALRRQFVETVRPFVTQYCFGCHGTRTPAAQFDLRVYLTVDAVTADLSRWRQVHEKLNAGQMPPAKMPQPPPALRKQVVDWIQDVTRREALKHAGDPGPVLTRRLSNAEYNNTIRDLTGVDIQPAREFPVDPANTEGFDNSGESLVMSPALFQKYLQAARQVYDPAHPRLLRAATYGLCGLLRGGLALQVSGGARKAYSHSGGCCRGIQDQRQISALDLEDFAGTDGAG
jgi:hypothetical protein